MADMTGTATACTLCAGRLAPCGGVRARFGLLECASCGHVESPAAALSLEAVGSMQREHFGADFVGRRDWWTRAFERSNARRIRRLIATLSPPPARCLEIGPGSGALLAELERAGFVAGGFDSSEIVAHAVRARIRGRVHWGRLEALAASAPPYDIVVMRHVLEHMARPDVSLAAVRALLRPHGLLYVAVPNIAAPEASLPGWTAYQPYHLHYFTPPNLRRLLGRAGFDIVRTRTREPFSGWVNAIINTVLGAAEPSASPASRRAGTLRTAYGIARVIAGTILWPIRLIQGLCGLGEEIEVVARKPGRA